MQQDQYVIDTAGANGILELERLRFQGLVVTKALAEDLLPHGMEFKKGRIVDLGCGAGEWVRMVAQKNPDVEIIGADVLESAIKYSTDQIRAQKRSNAKFRIMNILQPLEFDDTSCDLVNMRFLLGVVPKEYWPTLLQECWRILKPGGTVRITEPTTTIVEDAPNCHRLSLPMMKAFYHAGKTFSEYDVAIAPAINRFLKKAQYTAIQSHAYYLDCSASAPLHDSIVMDFEGLFHGLKPLMLMYGEISEDELDKMILGGIEELHSPEFSGLWGLISFQATKPR